MSIRSVANATGVTPPSIYRHFVDKTHLLFEVCARQFTLLDNVLEEAVAGIDDPVEAMAARGRAYVRFGVEHPEHYRIMFMGPSYETPDQWGDIVKTGSFAHLVEGIQRMIDAGVMVPGHRRLHDGAPRVGQHPRPHVAARGPARHALARPRAVRRRSPPSSASPPPCAHLVIPTTRIRALAVAIVGTFLVGVLSVVTGVARTTGRATRTSGTRASPTSPRSWRTSGTSSSTTPSSSTSSPRRSTRRPPRRLGRRPRRGGSRGPRPDGVADAGAGPRIRSRGPVRRHQRRVGRRHARLLHTRRPADPGAGHRGVGGSAR